MAADPRISSGNGLWLHFLQSPHKTPTRYKFRKRDNASRNEQRNKSLPKPWRQLESVQGPFFGSY